MTLHKPTVVTKRKIYSNRYFDVREDSLRFDKGNEWLYTYVSSTCGVSVVALDDHERVILLKEYRYPVDEELLALPSGGVEKDEKELESAQKELAEEAGFLAKKWTKIGEFYPSPGTIKLAGIIFLAQELSTVERHVEAYEQIEVVKVPFADAIAKVYAGEIKDAWAIISILMVNNFLNRS